MGRGVSKIVYFLLSKNILNLSSQVSLWWEPQFGQTFKLLKSSSLYIRFLHSHVVHRAVLSSPTDLFLSKDFIFGLINLVIQFVASPLFFIVFCSLSFLPFYLTLWQDFDVFLKIPLFPCIIGCLQPNHQLFLMKL